MAWTAIVLAGSRPGRDAFAESHGTDLKALIPVGGVPMVARPVAALLAAPDIGGVRVLAQQVERIAALRDALDHFHDRVARIAGCGDVEDAKGTGALHADDCQLVGARAADRDHRHGRAHPASLASGLTKRLLA